MKLSVVVSTLNDRERLLPCLDALSGQLPAEAELVVVNGPSSDGTTGAVCERDDVDVLVEISERSRSVSRNAGIRAATGDVVAFLGDEYAVEPSWYDAVEAATAADADVVTGPVKGGSRVEHRPARGLASRQVTAFDGDNVAMDRTVLDALDGFDEYLAEESAQDCAHRVARLGFDVTWSGDMAVRNAVGTDGGWFERDPGGHYRGRTYHLTKNYGPRPRVVGGTVTSAVSDGIDAARRVVAGETQATTWLRNGTDVASNALCGLRDGVLARRADRSVRRNPNGVSARQDRAVQVYDWR